MQVSRHTAGVLWCVGAAVLWSLSGVYSRLVGGIDVATAVVVRNSAAVLVFVAVLALRRGGPRARASLSGAMLLTGAVNAVSSISYIGALLLAPVANVAVIYATTPLFAALLSWLVLRASTSRATLACAGLALLGVVIVAGGGQAGGMAVGNALAVLMTATAAAAMVLTQCDPSIDAAWMTLVTTGLSALACLPFSHLGGVNAWQAVLLGLYGVGGGTAFVLLVQGVRRISSVEAGLLAGLDVVLAPLWVWLAFGEQPAGRTWLGGLVVLAAIGLQVARGRDAAQPQAGVQPREV